VLLHGIPATGVSQTLRRGTRNGITELSQRAPLTFGWAAITLGITFNHILVISFFFFPRLFSAVEIGCAADAVIIFSSCGFFYLSFFLLFSSPNLSCRRLDAYHTSTHDVALVRIWNACLKCAARGSLKVQAAIITHKIAICAPSYNFVGLYLGN